jgi:hypothetical protein
MTETQHGPEMDADRETEMAAEHELAAPVEDDFQSEAEPDDPWADQATDDEIAALIDSGLDSDREPLDRPPLFDGDTGSLSLVQRNAMNAVVKARFISAEDNAETWRALVDNRLVIASRLHDQYKHLHIDIDRGLSYAVDISQPDEGRPFTLLGRRRTFTREETAILAYARHRYSVEISSGQPAALVERREILDHVALMQPAWLPDKSAADKRAGAALDRVIEKYGLLVPVQGEETNLRIHRAIELFLTLDDVRRLDAAFRAHYKDIRGEKPDFSADAGTSADADTETSSGESEYDDD